MTEITQELIKEVLKRPDSFAYAGDLDLFNTWTLTDIGQIRDSGPLDISNFETIKSDLETRFPDDVEVVHSSHWLVGWTDQLAVKVIDEDQNPTEAFKAYIEWIDRLSEYPVADEEDYSRREYEDALDTLEWGYQISSDNVEDVYRWIFDNYSYCHSDEYTQKDVDKAIEALGLNKDE